MKRLIFAVITICLLAFGVLTGPVQAQTAAPGSGNANGVAQDTLNQEVENLIVLLRQLAAEVKELRLAMLQQRIQAQEGKLAQLERELKQAQAEQQRLHEQERATNQELAELEKLLNNVSLTAEERAGLEETRIKLG